MRKPGRICLWALLVVIGLTATVGSGPQAGAQEKPVDKYGLRPEGSSSSGVISRTVKLYFLRDASRLTAVINAVLGGGGGAPAAGGGAPSATINQHGMIVPNSETTMTKSQVEMGGRPAEKTVILNKPNPGPAPKPKLVAQAIGDDTISLYGPYAQVRQAHRLIAAVDLPRPGVNLDLWGVQISSRSPKKLGEAAARSKRLIDEARRAVRRTFQELETYTLREIPNTAVYRPFARVFTGGPADRVPRGVRMLGFTSALDPGRPHAITDILLRMVAAASPGERTAAIANEMVGWYRTTDYYRYGRPLDLAWSEKERRKRELAWIDARRKEGIIPFRRFFESRGLQVDREGRWMPGTADRNARIGRDALLEFALHYQDLVHRPTEFSPFYLQHAADILNNRVQVGAEALQRDVHELFIWPTLKAIEEEVRGLSEVEYSQVGSTTLATLSGVPSSVTSSAHSAFDATPPLTLRALLENAKSISETARGFIPTVPIPGTEATQEALMFGGIPVSQIIGLAAAFERQAVWRELAAGISLRVTPNVLRNSTSAELQLDLLVGDPQVGTLQEGVRPLSRVTKHEAKTPVYVQALDLFEISTFSSQSTMHGGRGYVPIIGHIWEGIFSDIPVIGNLFSWPKSPQKRYHQSLLLVNSIITPTAMGVALLYPTDTGAGH